MSFVRDSLCAAKLNAARICSIVSSGKSSIISSLDIPAANQPRISCTAIRVPTIQGFPNRIAESILCELKNDDLIVFKQGHYLLALKK